MDDFDQFPTCPKCTYRVEKVAWRASTLTSLQYPEHLQWTCNRCSHIFRSRCADWVEPQLTETKIVCPDCEQPAHGWTQNSRDRVFEPCGHSVPAGPAQFGVPG